jgi:hypothetical protein
MAVASGAGAGRGTLFLGNCNGNPASGTLERPVSLFDPLTRPLSARPQNALTDTLTALEKLPSFQTLNQTSVAVKTILEKIRHIINTFERRASPEPSNQAEYADWLAGVQSVRDLLILHYDRQGQLRQHGFQQALECCRQWLDPNDLYSVEECAVQMLDPQINTLVASYQDARTGDNWVAASFTKLGEMIKQLVLEQTRLDGPPAQAFANYLDDQLIAWAQYWGYDNTTLVPPNRGLSNSLDLVSHCLKLHSREILHQLVRVVQYGASFPGAEQDPTEQERIRALMGNLAAAWQQAGESRRAGSDR